MPNLKSKLATIEKVGIDAMDIICPHCRAHSGQKCFSYQGSYKVETDKPHKKRRMKAAEMNVRRACDNG